MNGNLENFTYNCLGFTSSLQRSFIANDLGPLLEQHGFNYVKILMLDDQRIMLPQWAQDILSADSEASKYVAGIAVHWYLNFAVPPTVLVSTHHQFPDKFILATEASEGSQPWDDIKVLLGSWERSENYAQDIIQVSTQQLTIDFSTGYRLHLFFCCFFFGKIEHSRIMKRHLTFLQFIFQTK